MEPTKERKGGRKLLEAPKSLLKRLTGRSSSRGPASPSNATAAGNATPTASAAVAPTPIHPESLATILTTTPANVPIAAPSPQDDDPAGEIPEFPLWDVALKALQADPKTKEIMIEYQKILDAQADRIPEQNIIEDASQPRRFSKVIKLGLDDIDAKMWKINLNPDRPIVIREQVNRIFKTVKQFSGVAAMAASFDPVHAGVAWAGVSAILPVSVLASTASL